MVPATAPVEKPPPAEPPSPDETNWKLDGAGNPVVRPVTYLNRSERRKRKGAK